MEADEELEDDDAEEEEELDEQVLLSESESEVVTVWLGRFPPVVSVCVSCRLLFVCVLFVCVLVCLWIWSDLVFMSKSLVTRGTMAARWRWSAFVDNASSLLVVVSVKSVICRFGIAGRVMMRFGVSFLVVKMSFKSL